MHSKVLDITPEMASEMLSRNHEQNRELRPSAIKKYVRDIVDNNWQVTHQGIAFSPDGKLLDGQHRLHAIVQSGCTVKMMVTYDAPEDTFAYLDRGAKRDLADLFHLPKDVAPVISIAATMCLDRVSPTDKTWREIIDAIGSETRELMDYCSSTATFYSNAVFKFAAVMSMISHPKHKEEIKALYTKFIKGNVKEMPDVAESLYTMVSSKRMKVTGATRREVFIRGMDAFNPNNWTGRKTSRHSKDNEKAYMDVAFHILRTRGVDLMRSADRIISESAVATVNVPDQKVQSAQVLRAAFPEHSESQAAAVA